MPKCEEDPSTGRVAQIYQPSSDICYDLINANKTNCKMIQKQLIDEWSSLFTCTDTNLYARNCSNELKDLTYSIGANSKQTCQYPLVPTSDNQNWFKDVDGCGLHCKFPIFNPSDQANISLVIKALCLIGLIITVLAMLLFKVNKASSKSSRMAKVIKRCTICQLLIYVGWSLQIFVNHEVGCKADGSMLQGQPLVANTCILSFILTYLPSLASLFWCAHLGRLCHEKLTGNKHKSPGSAALDRTLSLFNYGIPLTLFVSVAFLGHIDGHGLYGICIVGQQSVMIKTIFVFLPSIIGTVYGNYYFIRTIITIALVKATPMKPSLRRNFMRISALATLTILQTILTIVNYFYELHNHQEWLQSLEQYVGCQLNLTSIDSLVSQHEFTRQQECSIDAKPFMALYYLETISNLTIGIVISSWAFYESNYKGLKRKLIDWLEDDRDRQRRAKAYMHQRPAAISQTNGLLTGKPDAELDETYHDLVDMTSPTRCAGGGGEGDEDKEVVETVVDEINTANNNDDLDRQLVGLARNGPGYNLGARVSSRASLQSITMTSISMFNSENSSVANGFKIPSTKADQGQHHGRKAGQRGKTSRDVVNDCKQQRVSHQLQNGNASDATQQQVPVTQITMDQKLIDMFSMLRPENLIMAESIPNFVPQGSHGFGEN
jgi:smoothened protein